MQWYEWVFQGIGTEIIILLFGLIIGGFAGYEIGINKNGIQNQKAKDKGKQIQNIEIECDDNAERGRISGNLRQVQKAGSDAEQTQVGKIRR